MRLKSIKLAGFKSFIDPTHLPLQTNITAIVGPNGCGKSNIVDAIRWVIGESSAKQLRGESLTDVIFNGTNQRKPAGQAAIELCFDNSEGRIGGEYAQYAEIAIRRELSRDGQSQFYLNNTRCRRKDILDVFLGTGLGPRSYAIIEQGMISQLIEAKPEDIRIHLEEAAGISKYKERRRETENRIQHTRENLDRLNDLLEEIDKQLSHLKRQANAAERFTLLKQEQRLLKAQVNALQWQQFNQQLQAQQAQIQQQETVLEAKIADHRRLDADIEKNRFQQTDLNDIFNEVQGRYYQQGSDIARVEQQLEHIHDRQRQFESDLAQLDQTQQESEQHLTDDQLQIEELNGELFRLEPELEQLIKDADVVSEQFEAAEQVMADWQSEWETFNAETAKLSQKVQVEQTQLHHLSQRIQSSQQRVQRLQEQRSQLDFESLPEDIQALATESAELKAQINHFQQELAQLQEQISQQRLTNTNLQTQFNSARNELQGLLNQQTSLQALQKIALGKTDESVHDWLVEQQLQDKPRLAESLTVKPGWETAVETVLGPYLEAICIDEIQELTAALPTFSQGKLTLVYQCSHSASSLARGDSLASKVQSDWRIDALQHVLVAEDLPQALAQISGLANYESIITRDGIWLSSSWVRVSKATTEQTGVLQRKHALEQLDASILSQQQALAAQEATMVQGQTQLAALEQKREHVQQQFREASAQFSEIHGQLSAKQARLEQLRQRESITLHELTESQQQLQDSQQHYDGIQAELELYTAQTQQFEQQREKLLRQRDQNKFTLDNLRQKVLAERQKKDEYQVRLSSSRNQLHYLQQNIIRSQKQIAQFNERRQLIVQNLQQVIAPLAELKQSLAASLNLRLQVETELTTARENLTNCEHRVRELEKQRNQFEADTQLLRDQLEQLRVDQRAYEVKRDNYHEQITQADFQLTNLLSEMPAEAAIDSWQQQVEQLESRIQRLGPINLAAIAEFNTLSERKTYLDSQHQDLTEALTTLEEAIRKIDRESRTRLRETFDKANATFMSLFPKIFGGGSAQLELTDEDVLNTGVVIRAQPPGKRNSTIHLLSGGEKALTTIALVFSLFQLNPAPFCILDEVDAPLDDANVNRFCNLVKEMSQTLQFMFISHNKVTMEMAQQLVGVTMNEPGVSRLVSVDIEEAIAIAEMNSNEEKVKQGEGAL